MFCTEREELSLSKSLTDGSHHQCHLQSLWSLIQHLETWLHVINKWSGEKPAFLYPAQLCSLVHWLWSLRSKALQKHPRHGAKYTILSTVHSRPHTARDSVAWHAAHSHVRYRQPQGELLVLVGSVCECYNDLSEATQHAWHGQHQSLLFCASNKNGFNCTSASTYQCVQGPVRSGTSAPRDQCIQGPVRDGQGPVRDGGTSTHRSFPTGSSLPPPYRAPGLGHLSTLPQRRRGGRASGVPVSGPRSRQEGHLARRHLHNRPRRLWSYLERIGAVTRPPPTWNERERERKRETER